MKASNFQIEVSEPYIDVLVLTKYDLLKKYTRNVLASSLEIKDFKREFHDKCLMAHLVIYVNDYESKVIKNRYTYDESNHI